MGGMHAFGALRAGLLEYGILCVLIGMAWNVIRGADWIMEPQYKAEEPVA